MVCWTQCLFVCSALSLSRPSGLQASRCHHETWVDTVYCQKPSADRTQRGPCQARLRPLRHCHFTLFPGLHLQISFEMHAVAWRVGQICRRCASNQRECLKKVSLNNYDTILMETRGRTQRQKRTPFRKTHLATLFRPGFSGFVLD